MRQATGFLEIEPLRLWRGKAFEADPKLPVGGFNRLGFGPFEFKRYRFAARTEKSALSDSTVVVLDHDQPGNPYWVRILHDELVEMRLGLY